MNDKKVHGGELYTKISKGILEWLEIFVFSIFVVILLFVFLFRNVGVDGDSMRETLHNNDRVIIFNFYNKPKFGDIVVFSSQVSAKPLIKRVIGLPGDKIRIDFERQEVYVNDVLLKEKYIAELIKDNHGDVVYPVEVPEDSLFVMGDNRNHSHDSRMSDIGMVSMDTVLGKAIFRIYPISDFGSIYVNNDE